jgi:molybdopterin/thiamine biosynthesis adenylyltransferase
MDYTRQVDIFNPEQFKDIKIGVVGVGSVGSFVVLTLAKMGFKNITVWDDDTVEEHNLPNQFYPLITIGKPKVFALAAIIDSMTGAIIIPNNCKFTTETYQQVDILISAVDSIEARRAIWKCGKEHQLYIDSRMGGEYIRIFTIRGQGDYTHYEKSLERAGIQLPCTARTIIYNVLANASLVALLVKKFLKKEPISREITFDMKNMLLMNMTI